MPALFMLRFTRVTAIAFCMLLFGAIGLAQIGGWPGGGGRGGRGFRGGNPGVGRNYDRSSYPTWESPQDFEKDVFTFARVQYDSDGPFGWFDRWNNDFPDADIHFSMRLQQLTSMHVNPDAAVVRLTEPELLDYPFVYLAGVQYMRLSKAEQAGFRRYLENGGFFMMDDLWGIKSRDRVLEEMKKVLPYATPIELSIDHPVFHTVYDLKALPQVTDYLTWRNGDRYEYSHEGETGDRKPHFLAYFDQNRRMVGIVCHNNDIGDGWEREGEHPDFFELFSVKHSYPFGINIVTYAMTQ
ncbi:MAG: DUF4159 domain-containing protein [Planctomycetota bacterium]|nr:DUF4159 domain-containing protein [Planctomycetota bacterium]